MIVYAVGFLIEGMHQNLLLVPFSPVAGTADVEVLVEELFASVAMHVHIAELLIAKLAFHVTGPVAVGKESKD